MNEYQILVINLKATRKSYIDAFNHNHSNMRKFLLRYIGSECLMIRRQLDILDDNK